MASAINARYPRKPGLLTIPGVVASLLPGLVCPLCWPAYAALVSSLGLGFLASLRFLLPVTGALLGVTIVGLGLQVKLKGYGPFVLGLLSAAIILSGRFLLELGDKFLLESNAITYAGAAMLVIASAWSLAPSRAPASGSCPTCPTPGQGSRQSV